VEVMGEAGRKWVAWEGGRRVNGEVWSLPNPEFRGVRGTVD
jgi:hypothetical protein